MKKIITSLFIAIFVAQFFISGIDGINQESQTITSEHDQVMKFTSRQSTGMNGTVADCNFTNIADGMGGPAWQNGSTYQIGDIVEWPVHSGQFYQTTLNTTSSPEDGTDHWIGPCTCSEISEASNTVWDSSLNYSPWQIVEHNGSIWIAQDAGAPSGEEPGTEAPQSSGMSGNSYSYWAPCSDNTLCSSFNGQGGSVWQSTQSYAVNDTVEWPANSGQFWQSTTSGPTSEPDVNGKWIGPCSCKDIWVANSTNAVWDSNTVYDSGMIVEFPVNSGDIWIAISPSTTAGVDPTYPWADGNEWQLCSSNNPTSGGPCGTDVVGVWISGTNVSSGEVYEYPANSGILYVVNPGGPFSNVGAPDQDMDVWSPCETSPPSTTPCAGLTVVGIWSSTSIPVVGDVYEYPANSGNFYEIIFDHDGNISSPTGNGNEEFWLPIDCPCDETWIANGQPVWDSTILNYSGNYVVEWPAGSGILYISESGGITGAGEPGIDTHWIPCDGNPPLNGAPCNGSESSGVWNSTTVVEIEEVYEYPANSGSYYEVIQHDPNGLITTAPGEDQDYEFWSPISCTCEEKWVANGEPVWDATVDYPGNYVVAWPYGSNNLYVPLEPTGVMNGAEPGIDPHWIHCVDEDTTVESDEPEDGGLFGLPSIGVLGTIIAITMSVFVFGRDQRIH